MDLKAGISRETLKRAQDNPVAFVEKVLGGSPRWSKQQDILRSVRANRETYAMSCHGTGKTYCTADVILWFLFSYYPCKVIFLAPTFRQVKDVLWAEILSKYHRSKLPKPPDVRIGNMRIEISPDHFCEGFSPDVGTGEQDQGVRMQGFHSPNILVVFEEGPGVNPALWKAKDALMTSAFPRFLSIGNPVAAQGPFYEAWAKKRGNNIHLRPWDSPNFKVNGIANLADLKKLAKKPAGELEEMQLAAPGLLTPAWAADMLLKWGEESALFKSRVLGEFPKAGLDNLLSLAELQAVIEVKGGRGKGLKILGIDPARFGSNQTGLYGFQGFHQILRKVHQGMDLAYTANLAIRIIKEGGYDAVAVDCDGIGSGVFDKIREMRDNSHLDLRMFEVHNGGEPQDKERFTNLRAESYWHLRELVQSKTVHLEDDGELFHQLSSIRYKFNSGGKIEIESKESMRRRGIESPDEADAVVLATYAMEQMVGVAGVAGNSWLDSALSEDSDRASSRKPWE